MEIKIEVWNRTTKTEPDTKWQSPSLQFRWFLIFYKTVHYLYDGKVVIINITVHVFET